MSGADDFDHVILTRFSVVFTEDQQSPDEDWLAYRWGFFRDAAASSLAHQSQPDFTWLVFFDHRAPQWLREEVDELRPNLFTPVWLERPWSHETLREAVEQVAHKPFLISTRLDSDDALGVRFVEEVQARFDHQESMYVNFLCGVQVERSGQIFRYDEPVNPFISYIERRIDGMPPRTVFQSFQHGRSRDVAPVLNVVTVPLWMQVVHGSNLANSIRGPRSRPRVVNEQFALALDYRREVDPLTYVRERLVSRGGMVVGWLRWRYLAGEYVYARWLRLTGTRVIPQRRRPSR